MPAETKPNKPRKDEWQELGETYGALFEGEEGIAFKDGYTIKTLIGALFLGFIMMPAAIYMTLITGTGVGAAAQWVTIILFIEIAKRSFVKLSRQEIYILYLMAGGIMAGSASLGAAQLILPGGPMGIKIWDQYFIQAPSVKAFGISEQIPRWVCPPAGSEAMVRRTFLHKDWVIPLVVITVSQFLNWINVFSLNYLLFRFTSDVEKLPFPMAPVGAGGATALAESAGKKEGWRWRVFSIGSMIGVAWGAIYVVVPSITGIIGAKAITLIPIPFVDMTAQLGAYLPAASLGTMTNLAFLFTGFVLPTWMIVGQFIGALVAHVGIDPILYYKGILHTWQPGFTVIPTGVSNGLDFWIAFGMGTALAVCIIGIVTTIRTIRRSKKKREVNKISTYQGPPKGRGDFPIWAVVGVWFLTTLGFVILVKILVPGFPAWIIAIFGFVITPLLSYVTARMMGLTGVIRGVSFPYLKEVTFILSGYKGVGIWFAPIPYQAVGGGTQSFKQLELTKTKFISVIKVAFTTITIGLVCGFIFYSIIWRMGPIPSAMYPFIERMWPYYALMKSLWISITLKGGATWMIEAIKRPILISGVCGGSLILYGLICLVGIPKMLFYGLIAGIPIWPHHVILPFIGLLLRKFVFYKRFGIKTWHSYAPILLAGFGCGMGLIAMTSIGIALIARSVSQLVF